MGKTIQVLAQDTTEDTPREVEAEIVSNDALVRVDGREYHRVSQDEAGRWVYLPVRSR